MDEIMFTNKLLVGGFSYLDLKLNMTFSYKLGKQALGLQGSWASLLNYHNVQLVGELHRQQRSIFNEDG